MNAKMIALWVLALAALAVSMGTLFYADRLIGEGNRDASDDQGVNSEIQRDEPLIAAAGDIACDPEDTNFDGSDLATCQMRATEYLIGAGDRHPDAVLLLGDIQYENGSMAKIEQSYAQTWHQLDPPFGVMPSPGNHDYGTPGAKDYFDFFGVSAGEQGKGYYSFDLGAWHIVSLNSNCGGAGGCTVNSPQGTWLKQDLAAHPKQCTLAFWHHPRFTSGKYHPGEASVGPFWDILYESNADVVLNGHDHLYERFSPMDPVGKESLDRGIRQFTVGTGGRSLYNFTTVLPTSEMRADSHFGVLFMTLKEDSYDWEFVAVDGSVVDLGTDTCR